MKTDYVFHDKDVQAFKYCPYCGNEIMQVYIGDFMGYVQCEECEECEERLDFTILQEVADRFPKTWRNIYDIKEDG